MASQPKQLKLPGGWTEHEMQSKPGLLVISEGLEKTGKTDWALRFPKPLGYLSMDRKRKGKRLFPNDVYEPDESPFRIGPTRDQAAATEMLTAVKRRIDEVISGGGFRSLVIDTGSMLWDICRLSHLGALTGIAPERYDLPKADFRAILERIEDSHIHCCLTHKVKKRYMATEEGGWRGNWDGTYERAGFPDIGYMFHHTLVHERVTDPEDGNTTFAIRIKDSTNPKAVGVLRNAADNDPELDLDMLDFVEMATFLEPTTKPKDWR